MEVDLSQFFQSFFEESLEGLDIMEDELLKLEGNDVDNETINTIFRAAHSIKGGAGTFGFRTIADFTHVMETLLDQVREGAMELTEEMVDAFLRSVDCIRNMISFEQEMSSQGISPEHESYNNKFASDPGVIALKNELSALLKGENTGTGGNESKGEVSEASADVSSTSEAPDETEDDSKEPAWKVTFKPDADILKTGNDPIRMFRALSEMTSCTVKLLPSEDPDFQDYDVKQCLLSWELLVGSGVDEVDIRGVFDWVIDECDLDITKIEPKAAPSGKATSAPVGDAVPADQSVPAQSAQNVPKVSAPVEKKANAKAARGGGPEGSIRVGIDKIDSLVNLVGELVITQSMLSEIGRDFDEQKLEQLKKGLSQLEHNTRDLQESVMRIRMLPIRSTFTRFKRMVRDISSQLGKQVNLEILGESTELDKTVLERIGDPLVHLVRNSMDHGLETPDERVAAGKSQEGLLRLNAYHKSGNIIIEISDDGRGIGVDKLKKKAIDRGLIAADAAITDQEVHELIFHPGFSTAEKVTDLSGRGVGMDVVRRNIIELNGSIEVESEQGVGTRFIIRLPLTLAILDGQLVRLGKSMYIVPLVNIIESIPIKNTQLSRVVGGHDVVNIRNEYIPVIRLHRLFNVEAEKSLLEDGLMVIVESDGRVVGLMVDELLSQQQVVIKSMETNYHKVEGVAGATILGDGKVSLILEISDLVRIAGMKNYFENGKVKSDKEEAA